MNSYLQFMRIGKLRWCLLYFIQMSSVAETFQIKKNNSIMGLPIDNPLRTRLWHTLPLLLNPTQGTRGLRCTSITGPQNTQIMQNKMSQSQQHSINFLIMWSGSCAERHVGHRFGVELVKGASSDLPMPV